MGEILISLMSLQEAWTMTSGIVELDIHGMNRYQARICINAALRRAGAATYRIRVVHGFNGGTSLRSLVREEYCVHPKVLRIETSLGDGITDLILREF